MDSVISWAILTIGVIGIGIYFLFKVSKNNKTDKDYYIKWY